MTVRWNRNAAYGHVGAGADARQVERGRLGELIAVAEAEHGPVAEGEVVVLRELLLQARREQVGGSSA
ncbi:hypothetical protein [Streptomyces melanogenes]|uniref:hypothetical protein n=1 Tax=Streptomyces melanogenes TaxID=67326 RepID=UPI0037B3B324